MLKIDSNLKSADKIYNELIENININKMLKNY